MEQVKKMRKQERFLNFFRQRRDNYVSALRHSAKQYGESLIPTTKKAPFSGAFLVLIGAGNGIDFVASALVRLLPHRHTPVCLSLVVGPLLRGFKSRRS